MTEQELKNELKNEQFRTVYFIYGEDSYLKNHYAKLIAEKCVDILPDMNMVKMDGKKANLQKLADETEQLPCMAQHRCVLLTDYNFAAAKDVDKKAMIELVSDLPKSTVLIILCDLYEIDEKKPGEWSKLIKAASSAGGVLNFEHMSASYLQNMMIKAAQKRKVMLDLSTAKYMIDCCGREIAKLKGEIEKLCSYKGEDGRIEKADIDKLCAKTVDANKYQLSKYILSGDVANTLKMINDLFDMRMSEIEISMLIIGGFADVYRAKAMVDSGVSTAAAAVDFGYGKKREFVLGNSAKTANRLSGKALRNCIEILNDTDVRLKSTSEDKRFLLEQTVLRVIRELKVK